MKDFDVFGTEGVLFLNTFLRISSQGIGSSICLVLTVIDLEVVSRKFLSPADLLGAQTLHVHESTKVIVVYKNEDLVFATF